MAITDYLDYREYLNSTIKAQPNRGYGQAAKIAKSLDTNPSIITLVLKGQKDLTLEQAGDLADYLGLSELESEYLLALVSYARSSKENLRRKFKRQIDKIRAQAKDLKTIIPPQKELPEEVTAIFYSHWYFSAIRMLSSLEEFHSVDAIAKKLNLSKNKVRAALDFLVQHGLCLESNGSYNIGPQSTHLSAGSEFVSRHHANWRERAIFHTDVIKDDELFFTSPLTIAKKDIPKVRSLLVSAIENIFKIVTPSESEEGACLNIDWFRIS